MKFCLKIEAHSEKLAEALGGGFTVDARGGDIKGEEFPFVDVERGNWKFAITFEECQACS